MNGLSIFTALLFEVAKTFLRVFALKETGPFLLLPHFEGNNWVSFVKDWNVFARFFEVFSNQRRRSNCRASRMWLTKDREVGQPAVLSRLCKYRKVDFLDYIVAGSLQCLLSLLKIFFFHQYVVGVIGWDYKDADLVFCQDFRDFGQDTDQRKIQYASIRKVLQPSTRSVVLSGTSDVRHTSEISSSVLPMKKNLPFKSMSEIETTLQTDSSWSSVFNFISATSGKTIRKTYGLTNRFLRKPINRNTDFCPPRL